MFYRNYCIRTIIRDIVVSRWNQRMLTPKTKASCGRDYTAMNPGFDETASLIPDGHYKSIPDLVRKLNRCMTKEAQTKIKCSYVASKRIDIVTILGFEQDTVIEKETISPYVADMNGGFSSLYVYIYLFQTQNNLNNIIYEDNKDWWFPWCTNPKRLWYWEFF